VIKHTNPCGVATGATGTDAYVRPATQILCLPLAASSGSIRSWMRCARELTSTFIEAVIAPELADEARAALSTKANLRVVTADFGKLATVSRELSLDTRTFLGRADPGTGLGGRGA
jgi:phosphoribosylaminoimidazolecarboxamide formyltransferase/IMP cyclohydrolase